MTEKELYAHIESGERLHFEGKDASGGLPKSVWESYSSFANTDGGVMVLGLVEGDGKFTIQGVKNPEKLIKEFWDNVNNREKASVNVLFDRHVYPLSVDGKKLVVIEVPRAERQERPVYVGKDVFTGSFRRNGEGDYVCTKESVEAMIRDRCDRTADTTVLEKLGVEDLCAETVSRYRTLFKTYHPDHTWNELPDDEFLKKVGALSRSDDGRLHPNVAGLVCFGEFVTIMHSVPNFFLDYRARLTGKTRWSDRVCSSDVTWSGNIIDFYFRIHDKIVSDVEVPFALKDGKTRIDETDVHEAIREVLANALIHADYRGRQGIVIDKYFKEITISNPGSMRISRDAALEGGRSDPRNMQIFNIFALINIGERAGMGLNNLCNIWKREGFAAPELLEEWDPDRTVVKIDFNTKSSQDGEIGPRPSHEPAQEGGRIGPSVVESSQDDRKIVPSILQNELASIKAVYKAIVENPRATYRGLGAKLGYSKDTIGRAIGRLIKLKVIKRDGTSQTGHWEVLK